MSLDRALGLLAKSSKNSLSSNFLKLKMDKHLLALLEKDTAKDSNKFETKERRAEQSTAEKPKMGSPFSDDFDSSPKKDGSEIPYKK